MMSIRTALLLALLIVCDAALASAADLVFSDATESAGIRFRNVSGAVGTQKKWIMEVMGSGAAWLDHDGDGDLDLYLVNGSDYSADRKAGEPNRLYRNNGKGGFEDVTEAAGVGDRGWGYGAAVGDYDNDGDPDLYVTNQGANVLYRNEGDGTFADVTTAAGVGGSVWSASAAFFDMDSDGDLDLYVTNYTESGRDAIPPRGSEAAAEKRCIFQGMNVYCGPLGLRGEQDRLYRNDGDGTFTDATEAAGMRLDEPRYALGVVAADFDNDGDTDLYVANDSVRNSLWRNDGKGHFSDIGLRALAGLSSDGRAQAGMGTDFGDFNGDGWLDLVVTNFSHDLNTVYRNNEGRMFIDDSRRVGMRPTMMALSWATGFHDFDLDTDLDLFIVNGHVYAEVDDSDIGTRYRQRNHLFVNDGKGRFAESGSKSGPGMKVERSFRGGAFADYDNDGDVDVLVTSVDEPALLLRNDTPRKDRHGLQITLRGTASNRDGVGARVRVTVGDRTIQRERKGGGSYLSASDPRLHFGLGTAKQADRVEVRWPSGKVDRLEKVPADRPLTIVEGSGGS